MSKEPIVDNQSALIVKEDGLIYVNGLPEAANVDKTRLWDSFYESGVIKRKAEYESALASAKQSAILLSDQEEATHRLYEVYVMSIFQNNDPNDSKLRPGIYPIPDLKWEVKGSCPSCEVVTGCQALICHYKKVAILLPDSKPVTEGKTAEEILDTKGILWASGYQRHQVLEAMDYYAKAKVSEVTLPEKAEQTLPLNFWKRLEMFVENVQVNDPMSEEEKEMILMIARSRKTL